MTILYAEGFELGTSVAELGTITNNAWNSTNTLGTTTYTFGNASTGGSGGRSLSLTVFASFTSNTAANFSSYQFIPALNTATSTMTSYCWGFRGKLNSNFGGLTAGYGSWIALGTPVSAGGFGGVGLSRSSSSAALYLSSGTSSYGVVTTTPDYNWHYYTIVGTKSGSNWITKVYVDNVLMLTATLPGNFQTALNGIFYAFGTGAPATNQVNIFSEIDDVYVTINETAPLGSIQITKLTPNADVQAQFTRYGGQSTNYASVNKVSMDDTTGIIGAVGNADIYGVSNTTPTNMKVAAVNVTAIGSGTAADQVQTTASSGSTNIASAVTPMSPFGTVTTTGWDLTLAGVDVSTIQYGIKKV